MSDDTAMKIESQPSSSTIKQESTNTTQSSNDNTTTNNTTNSTVPTAYKEENELFVADESVLAYHGPMIYPAKILKAEQRETSMQYFIHYSGWNKKWDEWVDSSRLLKYNDQNIEYQRYLQASKQDKDKDNTNINKQSQSNKNKSSKDSKLSSSNVGNKRKLNNNNDDINNDDSVYDDTNNTNTNEVKIKIPSNLKKILINDWENITRKQMIVPIPHPIKNVTTILNEFALSKQGKGDANEEIAKEISIGIKNYFDRALGTILLYRFERIQYEDIVTKYPDSPMSDIYGVEHLLRLFVKLPALLQATKLDTKELNILIAKVQELSKWLDTHSHGQNSFFVKNYDNTDKEYQNRFASI